MGDLRIIHHIEALVNEEQELYAKGEQINNEERFRLREIEKELDQFWDLLRQRRALRDAGKDPSQAQMRSQDTVRKYEQ
jgi:hypothetical protein